MPQGHLLGPDQLRDKYLPTLYNNLKKYTQSAIRESQFIWVQTDGWKSKGGFKMVGVVYSFIIDYQLYIVPIDCVRLRGSQFQIQYL